MKVVDKRIVHAGSANLSKSKRQTLIALLSHALANLLAGTEHPDSKPANKEPVSDLMHH